MIEWRRGAGRAVVTRIESVGVACRGLISVDRREIPSFTASSLAFTGAISTAAAQDKMATDAMKTDAKKAHPMKSGPMKGDAMKRAK